MEAFELKGTVTVSDISEVMARIDALQAATQKMANANAAKIDIIAKELNDRNPAGLQAAIQAMANANAEKADTAQSRLDQVQAGLHAANSRLFELYKKLVNPGAMGGSWPFPSDVGY